MSDEAMLEPAIESLAAIDAAPEGLYAVLSPELSLEVAASALEISPGPTQESAPDWREELAAKMENYRTRRKPRAPKYPSLQIPLQLPVETFDALDTFRPITGDASRSSNALERAVDFESAGAQFGPELMQTASVPAPPPQPPAPTNLIEFPRSMESEAWDGLAEPVIEQPRILDAPELSPPEPALGGILLEDPQDAIPSTPAEVPLRPASIKRRFLAVVVDVLFVGCAFAMWGWTVSKITHEIPPRPFLLVSAITAAVILWLIYQYLLMVYSGATLGMRTFALELVCMDGAIPGRKQRRWRLLASVLSSASMMLGYAWVLLDENQLCWHDRITHTYLRVQGPRSL
jgi:uncharacterized RDD family membrane protein YckC